MQSATSTLDHAMDASPALEIDVDELEESRQSLVESMNQEGNSGTIADPDLAAISQALEEVDQEATELKKDGFGRHFSNTGRRGQRKEETTKIQKIQQPSRSSSSVRKTSHSVQTSTGNSFSHLIKTLQTNSIAVGSEKTYQPIEFGRDVVDIFEIFSTQKNFRRFAVYTASNGPIDNLNLLRNVIKASHVTVLTLAPPVLPVLH